MTDRVVKVSLAAQVNSFVADMQRAQKGTEKVGTAAEQAAAKMAKQTQAMRDVGGVMAAAGAVAVAATALAVKAAIDWETAWAGVNKTVNGTPAEMSALEDSLRSMARTLPATHQEIAAVAEAAGQLGVQREGIAAFTRTMIDLSETTNLTADEAATSIAQLMNVMQTAPDEVDNLGAALVALGNDGASTERDIVMMAQRIAGAGRIVGLTEAQVLGFANALASVGIEAEAGGTAISRIMTDIAVSVSQGGDELDQFAKVAGVSSKDFQKAFKEDPADAIATFVEGLARIDAEGGDVFKTLADLGQSDIRVSQALLGMANSGDLLRKSLNLGSVAWEENSALTDEAAKRYETTAAKLQVLGNKANDAAISFGDAFLPAISAVAEAVGGLLDGFSDLPDGIQQQIALLGGLGAAVTLAGGLFLLAIPKIAEFRIALGTLATSSIPAVSTAAVGMQGAISKSAAFLAGPWGIALAAAAVGALALQQALDRIKASSEEMQNALTTASDGLTILTTAAPSQFNLIGDIKAQFDDLDKTLRELDEFKNKPWWQPNASGAGLAGANDALSRIGKELSTLAASDLPAAQEAFQLLAAETDDSSESLNRLISAMGPEFEAALVGVASARKIDLGSMTDAERAQTLLNIAMEESPEVTNSAAQAYKDAASEANSLVDEITSLIEAVNESNSVGQDAVSANAAYQSALAGISEEVQRQKDEYEELNGTLDGFSLSLDQSTVSGSSNAAMLADVAKAAQDAALAQLEVDSATLGADAATTNYLTTIAAQRQAFIDSAIQAGFNADEVQALADKVFALPDEKAVKVIAETAAADAVLSGFITRWDGKRIKVTVDTYGGQVYQVEGSTVKFNERGGMYSHGVRAFANGGFPSGMYAGRKGGIHKFAEESLPWEVYISPKPSERERNLGLWAETGRLLGVPGFMNGGFASPQYATNGGGSVSGGGWNGELHVHAAPGMDENALVRKAVRAVQRELK